MPDTGQSWKELNFGAWKAQQAQHLAELEQSQIRSVEERRNLVRQTKEIKQLDKEEQDERLPDLLKLYQQEIDVLAKKLKVACETFKTSFTPLSLLPDPVVGVEDGRQSMQGLEEDLNMAVQENAQLRAALELARLDLARKTTELEGTQRTVRESADAVKVATQREQEVAGLRQALAEQEKQCMLLTNRNEEMVVEVGRLKKNLDELHSERVALDSRKSREETVKLAEFTMINGQLEHCRHEIVELQRENEILRLEVQNLRAETPKGYASSRLAELEEDLEQLQRRLSRERSEHHQSLAQKEKELVKLRLAKEELEILKGTEFGEAHELHGTESSLSVLLQGKTKRLEGELSAVRGELEAVQQRCQEQDRVLAESARAQADASIMSPSMISQGPDGMRQQIQQLQMRNSDLTQQLETQRLQSNRLQMDNAKLFERIKFLEAFSDQKRIANGEPIDSELGDLLQPYHTAYEEKLDPFRLFFKNEIVGRFKALGQTDRTIWRVGRVFLTNKFIRRFMAVYFVVLHLAMLYMLLRGDGKLSATAAAAAAASSPHVAAN